MTMPPAAYLPAWILAVWRGQVGGDDLLDVCRDAGLPVTVTSPSGDGSILAHLRPTTGTRVVGFVPDAGLDLIPGPADAARACVEAGQALLFLGPTGGPTNVWIPGPSHWIIVSGQPARPWPHDRASADSLLREAVVAAERLVREDGLVPTTPSTSPKSVPLPPGLSGSAVNTALRANLLWQAAAASGSQHTALQQALHDLRHTAALAMIVALSEVYDPVGTTSAMKRSR